MSKALDDEDMARMHKELGGDTAIQRDYLTESEKELVANIEKSLEEDDDEKEEVDNSKDNLK